LHLRNLDIIFVYHGIIIMSIIKPTGALKENHLYEFIQLPDQFFCAWFDGTQQGHFELIEKTRQWIKQTFPTALLVAYERVTPYTSKQYKLPEGLYLKLRDLTDDELTLLRKGVLQNTPLWKSPGEEILELKNPFLPIH
jgi:hypothetical protein